MGWAQDDQRGFSRRDFRNREAAGLLRYPDGDGQGFSRRDFRNREAVLEHVNNLRIFLLQSARLQES